jgi:hypothetical protein
MPNKNTMFDINRFCANRSSANNYSRQTTAGNDPSISNKMRYSQIVQSAVYKNVRVYDTIIPGEKEPLPTYYFPDGQVGTS